VLRCLFNDAVSVLDYAALTGRDSGQWTVDSGQWLTSDEMEGKA